MPIVTAQVGPEGALIAVGVGVSGERAEALRAAREPIPQPSLLRALIDTGAACTLIDSSVVKALALLPTGSASISTASSGATPHHCQQYDIALAIFMEESQVHVAATTIPVLESDLSAQGFHVLIGRDVLSQGVFWYNGRASSFSLAF